MTLLDWSNGKRHWRGGYPSAWNQERATKQDRYHGRWLPGEDRRKLCIHCKRRTFLCDENGDPSHKACAERAIDDRVARYKP